MEPLLEHLLMQPGAVEAGLHGAIEQIGLGESEDEVALAAAEAGLDGERLAQSKEVIGGVIEANEGAGQAADAALQSDAVLSLFMDFQAEVDSAGLFVEVALGGIGIVGLELVEVAELVQAQQAQLPVTGVVDLAFFEGNFAADDFVAGGGVALELDAADVELLAFVDVDFQIDGLLLVVELGIGDGSEVNVAGFAVGFAQVLEALGDFFPAENVAVLHREKAA